MPSPSQSLSKTRCLPDSVTSAILRRCLHLSSSGQFQSPPHLVHETLWSYLLYNLYRPYRSCTLYHPYLLYVYNCIASTARTACFARTSCTICIARTARTACIARTTRTACIARTIRTHSKATISAVSLDACQADM
jgi:hypothetical protein